MLKTGVYTQLSPVLFGSGTVKATGSKAKEFGAKKVLLVTDEGIRGIGHDKKVIASLEEQGIEVLAWYGAKGDCPKYSLVEGAQFTMNQNIDVVVGLGGGSSIDAAKVIAALLANSIEILDDSLSYLMGVKQYENEPLPKILIPTTAGTGAESTFVAVFTDPELDCKTGFPSKPTFAIVDPELTLGTPALITAFSGMDAFSHANESLTSYARTPHSDLLALKAIELITTWLPVAIADSHDLEARENLSLASNLAGIAFSEASVHVGHTIAHALGHKFEVPHGIGCAWTTPGTIEFTAKQYPERARMIARAMGVADAGVKDSAIGNTVADAVRKLMKQVGIPSPEARGLSREQVMSVKDIVCADPITKQFDGPIEETDVERLIAVTYDEYK